jgi:hypothetical protein
MRKALIWFVNWLFGYEEPFSEQWKREHPNRLLQFDYYTNLHLEICDDPECSMCDTTDPPFQATIHRDCDGAYWDPDLARRMRREDL